MSYIFDLVLAAALLFFLFLPITDRRTVMMKLGMVLAIVMLFAVTLAVPHGAGPAAGSAHALLITGN
ncbi:hypothetical protein SSBR45G_16330 [Bradyrhizobium sp. SSBR45G]|uniref:hypothetical protein n=1 Tax=unclassified Bradyrhizobium TaxID=2631580 RepID=UPI002342AE4C|nr:MULTISPECIES: hypothetical protein [unclassified Bradyrhizobium]GLH76725.1 hypothetical protein SSBR45G_16330 [Bradyrhizobium sp. SSBR45G]GLH83483.1 hypothetical protein SSBR45R_09430 [Bradyrhizobium sp. SSBR45R]